MTWLDVDGRAEAVIEQSNASVGLDAASPLVITIDQPAGKDGDEHPHRSITDHRTDAGTGVASAR